MTDDDLDRLRRDVENLKDRADILDCVARHARGCDRHDADLVTSTYHRNGVDEHGATVNAGPDYADWANGVHAATSANHLHNVTTHVCEIDGDVAHAESYVMV
ncbi:MAG: nuclear transport factor 2 family protein, partial [Acidimicrobiales bacterium]